MSWDSSAGLTSPVHVCCSGTDLAGVDGRALRGVPPAFGRGEDFEGAAFRPGRLVLLNQPDADHVIDHPPGGVGVGVKMPFGEIRVRHGAV